MPAVSGVSTRTPVSYYIKLLVAVFLMFFFSKIVPPWGGITEQGLASLGIFLGLVWMIINNFGLVSACAIAIFAVVMTGFYDGTSILASTLGSTSTVQMFFVYALCGSLIDTGAGEFVAKKMITLKIVKGRPMLFLFVLLFAAWLMGAFVGISAGLLLLYTIMEFVCSTLGYDESSDFNMMTCMGLQTSCMIGSALLPFKGIVLSIFLVISTALETVGITITFSSYMLGAIIIGILYCIGFLVIMRVIFRVDVSKIKELDITQMEGLQNLHITPPQIISLILVFIGVMYSVFLLIIPEGALHTWLSGISLWLWAAMILGVLCLIKWNGKTIVSGEKLMHKINWGVVLAVAAFSVIGGMMSNPDLGVRGWIGSVLSPIFSEMPFPLFMLILVAICVLITNFFSNLATGLLVGSAVAPFVVEYSINIGIDGSWVALALTISCMFAYLTMAAAGPAPLLLGKKCYADRPLYIWSHGIVVAIMGIILFWAICTVGAYFF